VSELPVNQILCGDCIQVMNEFPKASVDLVVTSPPYWGLRDYGVDGQIGLEDHPNKYIESLVLVARQIRRVLKKSGSFYLNLGDTYFGKLGFTEEYANKKQWHPEKPLRGNCKKDGKWLQPKQLMLIPSRTAIALQEDGWVLRNDIVWFKPNHMPSSVTDRLTNSWEHVFHFVKARKYFYDLDAIRKPHKVCGVTDKRPMGVLRQKLYPNSRYNKSDDSHLAQFQYKGKFEGSKDAELFGSPRARTQRDYQYTGKGNPNNKRLGAGRQVRGECGDNKKRHLGCEPKGKNPGDIRKIEQTAEFFIQKGSGGNVNLPASTHPQGKNPSDFWKITTKPFNGAHFAVFPPNLIKPIIKSSCPKNGVVLDPFCGSGTALVVAHKLGRKWVGIDLNPKYKEIALKRLESVGAFSKKLMDFNLAGL